MPSTASLALQWARSATKPARSFAALVLIGAVVACTDRPTGPNSPLGGPSTVNMPVPTVANTSRSAGSARSPSQFVDLWTIAARLQGSRIPVQWFFFRNAGNEEWYIVAVDRQVMRLAGTGSRFDNTIGWQPINNWGAEFGFPAQQQNFQSLSLSDTGQFVSFGALSPGASSDPFIAGLANSTNTVQWVYFQDTEKYWYVGALDGREVYALDKVDETTVYWQPIHNGKFILYPDGPNAFVSVTPSADHRTITFGALAGASATCGDAQLDGIIASYFSSSYFVEEFDQPLFRPSCGDFSRDKETPLFFEHKELVAGLLEPGTKDVQDDDAWAILQPWLLASLFTGYGADAWRCYYGIEIGTGCGSKEGALVVNSGYRPPGHNSKVGGVLHSRHMYGDALDVANGPGTPGNWRMMAEAALRAEADIIEPMEKGDGIKCPCTGPGYVHADWRYHEAQGASGMNLVQGAVTSAALLSAAIPVMGVEAQTLSSVLEELTSSDYQVRRSGFYRIFAMANEGQPASASLRPGVRRVAAYAREHPEVTTGLIALLERENRPDPEKDPFSEDSYYGDLIGCVAELEDPRAVDGLLGRITTGGLAERGLAALGPAAVPGLLQRVRSQGMHEMVRSSAVRVLGMIALQQDVMIDTAAIKAGLVDALADPSMYVRSNAVRGLGSFSDPQVRAAMVLVAARDPMVRRHGDELAYPVRDLARAWIARDDSLRVRNPRK